MDTSPQPFPACMRALAAAGLAMFLREVAFKPVLEDALRQRLIDTCNRIHDSLPDTDGKTLAQSIEEALDWLDAQDRAR